MSFKAIVSFKIKGRLSWKRNNFQYYLYLTTLLTFLSRPQKCWTVWSWVKQPTRKQGPQCLNLSTPLVSSFVLKSSTSLYRRHELTSMEQEWFSVSMNKKCNKLWVFIQFSRNIILVFWLMSAIKKKGESNFLVIIVEIESKPFFCFCLLVGDGLVKPEALNKKAIQIINRVRDKLTGRYMLYFKNHLKIRTGDVCVPAQYHF